MTTTRFRVQGITDDVTTCECCGLTNLKRTVRLIQLDADGNDMEAVYYGTSCAAKAAGTTTTRIRRCAAAAESLVARATEWALESLPAFRGMSAAECLSLNPSLGTLEAADRFRLATIAEYSGIVAGQGLVGTRWEREYSELPVVTMRTRESATQGALW
jgi:hypothetical protein